VFLIPYTVTWSFSLHKNRILVWSLWVGSVVEENGEWYNSGTAIQAHQTSKNVWKKVGTKNNNNATLLIVWTKKFDNFVSATFI